MIGFIGTLDWLNFARPCKPKINPKTGVNTMPKAPASRFKAEVLKMLANGQTAAYIANSPGIFENIIYRWKSMNRNGGPARGEKVLVQQGDLALENPGGEPRAI